MKSKRKAVLQIMAHEMVDAAIDMNVSSWVQIIINVLTYYIEPV